MRSSDMVAGAAGLERLGRSRLSFQDLRRSVAGRLARVIGFDAWSLLGATPAAAQWIRDQGRASPLGEKELPPVVYGLAAWLEAFADAQRRQPRPRVRMRGPNGAWLVVSADRLDGKAAGEIAVTIQPASPAEILPLLMTGYGLSDREGRLVGLVLDGRSTTEIAKALFISPYTVQDHLKSVCSKVGVSSRRKLAGRLVNPRPS